MKTMNPIHKIVAREMALGFSLAAICEARNLDYTSWKRITTSTLFKEEVNRIGKKLEEQELEAFHENPAIQKLKAAQLRAADTLIEELDNCDKEMGGSASTRIKAATSVFDYSGMESAKKDNSQVVVVQISENKQALLSTVKDRPTMPAHITAEPVTRLPKLQPA